MSILFISKRGEARAQIAEGLARQIFGTTVPVASAGAHTRPDGCLHPMAAETMKEINVDITSHEVTTLSSVSAEDYDIIVCVCESNLAPETNGSTRKLHWPLPDPTDPPTTDEDLRRRFRELRTAISMHIKRLGQLVQPRR